MRTLSAEQEHAIDLLNEKHNVIAYAVPGGGKSTLLLEICKRTDVSCVILAYNTELAEKMHSIILEHELQERVKCFTFHGLCSHVIGLTPDDISFEHNLERVKNGEVQPRTMNADLVLVDEAQDLKVSFTKLIDIVFPKPVQFFICGDVNQMIYDFDPESSAELDIIHNPHKYFASDLPWKHIRCATTYRMTMPICSFLNKLFETSIVSRKMGTKVIIRCPPANDVATTIMEFMSDIPQENMLLVSRKKGNYALRKVVNSLSKRDIPIHISGYDDGSTSVREGKFSISTWHSSKGMENKVVFVYISDEPRKNPLYVALSRALERLVIIMDPLKPSSSVSKIIRLISHEVDMDEEARDVISCASIANPARLSNQSMRFVSTRTDRYVGSVAPSRTMKQFYTSVVVVPADTEFVFDKTAFQVDTRMGTKEDVGHIYAAAVNMYLEFCHTGHVRFVEDALYPARIVEQKQTVAMRLGHMGRFVYIKAAPANLLPVEVRDELGRVYATTSERGVEEYCFMALATTCWNDFHHLLAQLSPVATWTSSNLFSYLTRRAASLIPEDSSAVFDVRRHKAAEKLLHLRIMQTTSSYAVHTVWSWETSEKDIVDAAMRAAFHVTKQCYLVNILTGEKRLVKCLLPDNMIHAVVNQ
jgi:hypothetical protein